jgi:hypothetical protein
MLMHSTEKQKPAECTHMFLVISAALETHFTLILHIPRFTTIILISEQESPVHNDLCSVLPVLTRFRPTVTGIYHKLCSVDTCDILDVLQCVHSTVTDMMLLPLYLYLCFFIIIHFNLSLLHCNTWTTQSAKYS